MLLEDIERPLLFFDVETTGMGPKSGGRVLEVGALRVESGRVVATMNTLVDPEMPVPYFITGITGITDEHVAQSPVFADVIDELEALSRDALFIAHNVNFDYSFIRHEYGLLARHFDRDKLCTVRLSRALYPDAQGHSLGKLIERHGYRVNARHRAYDDAEVLHRFVHDSHEKNPDVTIRAIARLIQPA